MVKKKEDKQKQPEKIGNIYNYMHANILSSIKKHTILFLSPVYYQYNVINYIIVLKIQQKKMGNLYIHENIPSSIKNTPYYFIIV